MIRRTILAFLFLALPSHGQEPCSAEKEMECAGQNRTCADEECGDCVEGQIEIFDVCVIPDQIDFDSFQEKLAPYLNFTEGQGVCDANGNETCAEEFRHCIETEGVPECGNCINGYIEYEEECILLDSVNFTAFVESYEPIYIADPPLTPEERAGLIEFLARFISAIEGLYPPLPFSLGINRFSADTKEEYESMLGYDFDPTALDVFNLTRFDISRRQLQEIPSKKDWVAEGKMTPVKNQERCGSCWAVSLMASVESAAALTPESSGYLQDLSFQQLVSCDTQNSGCNGGNIILGMGYTWLNDFGGVATLADYPYTDGGGQTSACNLDDKEPAVFLEDPILVLSTNDDYSFEERMEYMKRAASIQPVTMVLKSNCNTFQSYRSGVLTDDGGCACEETSCIDHAVVLVGYDDEANPPYWKLRNSWGTGWGESGYFRIAQQGGGRWGLFGMLAEAVIPFEAYNSTGAVAPPSGAVETGISWMWTAAAGVVTALVING